VRVHLAIPKSFLSCSTLEPTPTHVITGTTLHCTKRCQALLQHGANAELRNSENKTPLDLADASTKPILTGEHRKDELLEAARTGDEQRLHELLTPLNVNCHASDGRRSTPLHLASGYNRIRVVQILLQHGADVHAKDKGGLVPLHNSSSYGHLEVSQLLIKAGANVNASGEMRIPSN
jgi:tankyrase